MQDEVTKHSKKIYDTVRNSNQNFGEKFKEVVIEIFIIVFAVTLSISLHSWSEHRQERSEAREFLTDLKEDLKSDIQSMEMARHSLAQSVDSFRFIAVLTKSKIDSLDKAKVLYGFHVSIGTTKLNNGNYEGFKSSGKIGFIENKDLKKDILKYYQDMSPGVLEVEKIDAAQMLKIADFMAENAGQDIKERILNPKFKAMVQSFQSYAISGLDAYQEAIALANQIIGKIEKQE